MQHIVDYFEHDASPKIFLTPMLFWKTKTKRWLKSKQSRGKVSK
jgi:hypothetical protein